jgi:hypothetical protein
LFSVLYWKERSPSGNIKRSFIGLGSWALGLNDWTRLADQKLFRIYAILLMIERGIRLIRIICLLICFYIFGFFDSDLRNIIILQSQIVLLDLKDHFFQFFSSKFHQFLAASRTTDN